MGTLTWLYSLKFSRMISGLDFLRKLIFKPSKQASKYETDIELSTFIFLGKNIKSKIKDTKTSTSHTHSDAC